MAGPVRKRETHIASEQRRRQHIKDGFRKLSEQLRWNDEGGATAQRSEVAILQRSIEYIKELVAEQNDLEQQIRAEGKTVPMDTQPHNGTSV
ncbi:hypothetical protein HDU78_004386 [Chytriomyces hyalinus]|uniref:BHLH domain-containing protein n=1 Tax=Chytriomyces confervae TaxID=246404 RepID=A0A507FN99_9FUNG|nr:hypothetical protein HDU78_004386 [Chytriomyces hyalinus]KAJ3266159.1 hypothetical protein HDU77_002290 [Chytriomyces hyalinus]KAJ3409755.1 hypothetical protein HDU80_009732 [Chytriomyces hyalinus]TPX77899.1 hypothetical protein CcCBS67573_g00816 [Chytriomyces confervae]